jgi:hypothetical protein
MLVENDVEGIDVSRLFRLDGRVALVTGGEADEADPVADALAAVSIR